MIARLAAAVTGRRASCFVLSWWSALGGSGFYANSEIGRFTAPTFHVLIPMTGTEPEQWESQGQVFAQDQPFGLPSDIVDVIVTP